MSTTALSTPAGSDWFRRLLLPGLAFKAMVIGGGYATGRELAEFFMPGGAWGGLFAMLLAASVWSLICALTFLFGRVTQSFNYRDFFKQLLGPFWFAFEGAFLLCAIIALAAFGAASGAIANTVFGWPHIVGTIGLLVSVTAFVAFGDASVEALFKYVSFLLYGVYLLFFVLAFTSFGDRIAERFSQSDIVSGWAMGGLSYASYNLMGAVLILPVIRHMRSDRDAVVAGLLAGPLAMAPAILFFICMASFPELQDSELPSDNLLSKLGHPVFHTLFQVMILSALLESSTGIIHSLNQRVASVVSGELTLQWRVAISLAVLALCMFLATRFGLVALIASGYRLLAIAVFATFIVPLVTVGLYRLFRRRPGIHSMPEALN